MRDGLGGTVSLVIVSVFIVIALGYMAFNINYTKAFRVKDKIISLYEDYEGDCNSACQNIIRQYATSIGYSSDNSLDCAKVGAGYHQDSYKLYCYKEVTVITSGDATAVKDNKERRYYKIVTKMNIQIPVIKNVFNFSVFYIRGDTKAFDKD